MVDLGWLEEVESGMELTGWEEHVRDEAWECGEIAAMREEARREEESECAYEQECRAEAEAEDRRRYPGGRCVFDVPACERINPTRCETAEEAALPF